VHKYANLRVRVLAIAAVGVILGIAIVLGILKHEQNNRQMFECMQDGHREYECARMIANPGRVR
jgi:hypothetical protein